MCVCHPPQVILKLHSTAADDLVLTVIAQRCHALKELYVQDSAFVSKARETKDVVWAGVREDRVCVTSRGLYQLAYGICTSLTRLQLVCCDGIDYEGIRHLMDSPPPRLMDLQFRNCKGVGLRAYQLIGSSEFGTAQVRRLCGWGEQGGVSCTVIAVERDWYDNYLYARHTAAPLVCV